MLVTQDFILSSHPTLKGIGELRWVSITHTAHRLSQCSCDNRRY